MRHTAVDGHSAVRATRTPDPTVLVLKRLMDIAIGALGTLLYLVTFPLIALWIKLDSRGPIIYKQERVGLNRRILREAILGSGQPRKQDLGGAPFVIYKYRTMIVDSEADGPKLWKKGGDPRVTGAGKWLRKLHLDEMPQFWNILRGEMSFIGPRPERPQFTVPYAKSISHYDSRTLLTKPGLSGLAQIILGYDESMESVVRKSYYDLSYSASLSDFRRWWTMESWILVNTVKYIIWHRPREENSPAHNGKGPVEILTAPTPLHEDYKNPKTTGIIRVQGNRKNQFLSGLTSEEIDRKLDELAGKGRRKIEISLNPDAGFDLEDLGFLVNLVHKVKDIRGKLSIRNAHPRVSRVLREIHMDKIVELESVHSSVTNFLTIDVECWFHAYNLQEKVNKGEWHLLETRVVENVRRILDLLQTHRSTATFFVLGWVAKHFPEVVSMIEDGGHEIGTHGYSHNLITNMTVEEFEEDLDKSLEVIGRVARQKITAYRGSNFTVTLNTLWALKILSKYGIEADSSIFPIGRKRYGIPNYPNRLPHRIQLDSGQSILEFPMSTLAVRKKLFPVAGGGYLRLYPYRVTDRFIEQMNRKGYPAMVYFHPWELDTEQERLDVSLMKRFQHYVNLHTTEWKVSLLLERFKFSSLRDARQVRRTRRLLEQNTVTIRGLPRLESDMGRNKPLKISA